MRMLYDSDRYCVVWCPWGEDPSEAGYEIVDKAVNAETFLHGDIAQYFSGVIDAWQLGAQQDDAPSQDEVEEVLSRLTSFGQLPVVLH